MTQVIYKIINLVNDKFYVGSTNNKKVRFRQHRKLLRGSRHHCKHLQAAWNKYGEAKFDFVVVEEIADADNLQAAEDRWLQEHVGQPYCYNSGYASQAPWRSAPPEVTPNFGRVMSQEQKLKVSQSLKEFYAEDYFNHPRVGKQHTEETKAKISAAKLANPTRYWEGQERSAETKAKIGNTQRGKPKGPRKVSEEGRAKIRANIEAGRSHMHWVGKKHTEASKEKMMRPILATLPDASTRQFRGLSEASVELTVFLPTLIRACKSGKAVSKGPLKGWRFEYVDKDSLGVYKPS